METVTPPPTYTKTNNPVATYGEQSPAVLTLQQTLNQTNKDKPGYTPLKEDGLYGPLTFGATTYKPPENQLVVGSGPADMEFSQYSNDLSKALALTTQQPQKTASSELGPTSTDPYSQMLDKIAATSNASTKALIASIQASKTNQKNNIDKQFDNYKRGLQLLGIQSNEANATPDLLIGHLQEAESQHLAKIQDLDVEEKKLLMDAENAQAKNDLDTLKAKMDRVEQIQEEKRKAIQDSYASEDQYMQKANFMADEFYSQIAGLSGDQKLAAINELSKQTGIPPQYITAATANVAQKKSTSGALPKKPDLSEKFNFPPKDSKAEWEKEFTDAGLDDATFEKIAALVDDKGYSLKQLAQIGAITAKQYDYLSQYTVERDGTGGGGSALINAINGS